MVKASQNVSFPKSRRLLTRAEFQQVFDRRTSVADRCLVVYAAANDRPYCRLGMVVSRKVGNAVLRNRWKRRLREAFRLQQHALPAGWDFVVLPRVGSEPDWDEIRTSLRRLVDRAVSKTRTRVAKAKPRKGPPTKGERP